ncbi:MAG: nuclear transport factor 2 family protein [Acetobacteraceae bacterium]|jgi:uncharacterized protein (TIGR02246 family)
MTRFLAIVSVLAIGSAVSAAAQQVSEQDAQQAGRSVLDAWNKTFQQKDAAGHAALYTEDAVRVTPHGLISGRASIESDAAEGLKDYTPDPSALDQVKMIGNGVMLRAGTWSGTYHGPSGPVHLKGYWSDTDVRDGNTWKIRQETYTVTPPKN